MSTFPKSCPHCDAGPEPFVNGYLCGTYLRPGHNERKHQSKRCMAREIENKQERIRQLIAERDKWQSAAEQSWKLREEFKEMLGTDDVAKGLFRVKCWITYADGLVKAGNLMANHAHERWEHEWCKAIEKKP